MRRLWFLALLAVALPAASATPPVVRQTLANGVRVQVSAQPSVPMVIVDVLVDAGTRLDPVGEEGLANLTADLLTEGAGGRTAEQIHEAADFIGASLSSAVAEDYAYLNLKVLSKDLDEGLDLLADCLLRPTFAEAEVARRKTAILASIRASEDNPGAVASRAFDKALHGSTSYGHPVQGWPETVPDLGRAAIAAFYERTYRPGRTIVTVVGDVDAGAVIADLEKRLAGWTAGEGTVEARPAEPPPPRAESIAIHKPLTQANILLGHRGVARDHPDWYAITVMNHILGGGSFSSRLFSSVRTRAGLAYSVYSGFTANKEPGAFQVSMQTKSASWQDAVAMVRAEIERMRSAPVTAEELKEAQQYLTGSFPMRFDNNGKIAGMVSQIEFFGLGDDYLETYADRINAVTAADVQRAAQQYLKPEEILLVVVGPPTP
jgi:zinc protease